ncbi:MAG: acetolactate synthase [Ruminococcaceae bacterium]|nr:acetolactate synthase [Oscillospiraceae bacterium]
MSVKQISVFLENKEGRLAEVTRVMGENHIDISAISIADTTNFGILRMVVGNPVKAEAVLKEHGYAVRITSVLVIAVEDIPGNLSMALDTLDKNSIAVDYIYASMGRTDNRALVVLKVSDMETAMDLLSNAGICVLKDDEVYRL